MRNDFVVGIDLGTSTSEVAVYQDGKIKSLEHPNFNTPVVESAIAYYNGEIYIGGSAINIADEKMGKFVTEFKRDIGTNKAYFEIDGIQLTPIYASALLLKYLQWIAERNGYAFDEAVISVPANFPQAARYATLIAAQLAGIRVIRLINEPTAAILSYSYNQNFVNAIFGKIQPVLVFDFGGGTLDITILETQAFEGSVIYDAIASYGNTKLGGKDIDEEIARYIIQNIPLEYEKVKRFESIIKRRAKLIKETVSESEFTLFLPVGLDHIIREEFDLEKVVDIIKNGEKNIFDEVLNTLNKAIHIASEKHRNIDKDNLEVLLVGGSVKFKPIKELLERFFNRRLEILDDPQLAVSKGAAIAAALEKEMITGDIILVDVSPFGIGVEIVKDPSNVEQLFYSPLIQPNERIPYEITRQYTLLHPNQSRLDVGIYQAREVIHEETPLSQLEDIERTPMRIKISNIPPSPNNLPNMVLLKFKYTSSGIIEMKVTIKTNDTGKILKENDFIFTPIDMQYSEEDIRKMKEEVEYLWKLVRKS